MGGKASKSPRTVAVCGATGNQGGATVNALVKLGGFQIRCLTRNPLSDKSTALASMPGVTVVQADFDDVKSLENAFEGCDAIFAVTDFWQACGLDPIKELNQGKNLVNAAKTTGVKHFVWSTLEDTRPLLKGADVALEPVNGEYVVPHFDAKGEIDAYMRSQLGESRCTSIYTSIFYQNFLPNGGMDPKKQPDGSFAIFMATGDAKLAWCSTKTIGDVAAQVIKAGPKKYGGKNVPVVGEVGTCAQIAEIMSKVTGIKVNGVTVPPAQWIQAVISFGVPELAAKDLGNMFAFYEKCDMLTLRPIEETYKIYPETQSFEQFVVENKDVFAKMLE